jgi:hypothetical protein
MDPAAPEPHQIEDLVLHLELSGTWLDRKIAALRCQATQTASIESAMGEDVFRRWVAVESFVELRVGPRPDDPTPSVHASAARNGVWTMPSVPGPVWAPTDGPTS